MEYNANGLLYVSKAMDLFNLGARNITDRENLNKKSVENQPYTPSPSLQSHTNSQKATSARPLEGLVQGLSALANHPTLILGVAIDRLFPGTRSLKC